jgi:hypothetical protein
LLRRDTAKRGPRRTGWLKRFLARQSSGEPGLYVCYLSGQTTKSRQRSTSGKMNLVKAHPIAFDKIKNDIINKGRISGEIFSGKGFKGDWVNHNAIGASITQR